MRTRRHDRRGLRRPGQAVLSVVPERAVVIPIKRDAEPSPEIEQARRFARLVAEALADILRERGTVFGADVSPRPTKEMEPWREEANPSERSDPIDTTDDGESSWSQQEAKELLRTMRTSS